MRSKSSFSPIGPILPLSPFFKIAPLSRLPVSVGIEAKIEILKGILGLPIDAEGSVTYDVDVDEGEEGGGSISGGLHFNLVLSFFEVVARRTSHKVIGLGKPHAVCILYCVYSV